MIESRSGERRYLGFERLSRERPVAHAIFTRLGGVSAPPFASLNASISVGDTRAAVRRNRALIAGALGLPLVSARPVHGATVLEVSPVAAHRSADDEPARPAKPDAAWRERLAATEADAMMTDVPGFALFWSFADCVPVLLYDPRHRAIALVHAGWRGTARAVAPRTVSAMADRFGSRPAELLAGIAPSIGVCCYQVTEEVRDRFRADPLAWASACFEEHAAAARGEADTRLYLDLWESNRRQLLAAGLAPDNIELAGICTGCRTDLFFSHRVERGATGRFGVAIGLRGPAAAAVRSGGDRHG